MREPTEGAGLPSRLPILDEVQWAEPGSQLPRDEHWIRSNVVPGTGETRLARISSTLVPPVGSSVHLLFRPSLSSLNGWDEFPEEISLSGIVSGKVQSVLKAEAFEHWICVEVVQFIELSDWARLVKPAHIDLPDLGIFRQVWFSETQEWLQVEGNSQSDVGASILCRKLGARRVLLLHGEWGLGSPPSCHLVNSQLSEDEARALESWRVV